VFSGAYLLRRPVVVLRRTTEWVELVETGMAVLCDIEDMEMDISKIVEWRPERYVEGLLGDENAPQRIAEIISSVLQVYRMVGGVSIICVFPPRQSFGRATGRLIADISRFRGELGFEVTSVRGLRDFAAALLRGRVVVVLYHGFLSPVARSFLELLYKLLYLFVYLLFAVVLRRRFILYVYDLPIEQNLAVWGRVPHVGLSRFFEMLFLGLRPLFLFLIG